MGDLSKIDKKCIFCNNIRVSILYILPGLEIPIITLWLQALDSGKINWFALGYIKLGLGLGMQQFVAHVHP